MSDADAKSPGASGAKETPPKDSMFPKDFKGGKRGSVKMAASISEERRLSESGGSSPQMGSPKVSWLAMRVYHSRVRLGKAR